MLDQPPLFYSHIAAFYQLRYGEQASFYNRELWLSYGFQSLDNRYAVLDRGRAYVRECP